VSAEPAPVRTRDAARTRAAILAAAERQFAARGVDATSLGEIAAEAGVSRGTPSYFFGAKEELHVAVLERLYRARNEALGPVFEPLGAWARSEGPARSLRSVLTACVEGYLGFLHERPAYVDIIEREALAGGDRLARLENQSTVMEDAFGALRRHAGEHRLAAFDPGEAIICLVALGYMPVAHRTTILRRQGLDLDDPRFLRRRTRHIVDVLLHVLGAPA
jgi:TetR/AcrR family transcriptional regulator